MNKEDNYSYWSENLHSSYLFYTMEVDKLSKENKRLREALEKIHVGKGLIYCRSKGCLVFGCRNPNKENRECKRCYWLTAKQALGE